MHIHVLFKIDFGKLCRPDSCASFGTVQNYRGQVFRKHLGAHCCAQIEKDISQLFKLMQGSTQKDKRRSLSSSPIIPEFLSPRVLAGQKKPFSP